MANGNTWLHRSLELLGISAPDPQSPIVNLNLSGTYDDDDENIEAAINGILAALRANGILDT